MESYLLFTLFYILFSFCFIFPPTEFESLGLTVDNLFSNWLKNEADCFIHHHIRRTVAAVMTHSCIPLGYIIGVKYLLPAESIWEGSFFWNFYLIGALTLPFVAAFIVWSWYEDNWRNHPIAKNLMHFTTSENNINRIAMDIDNEYRRIDKIIIRCSAVCRVVATDNWIIKISPYTLNFAHQSDASLVVTSSDTHVYIPGRPEGGQFLNIEIKPNRQNIPSFFIRINSIDFKDLQDKVMRPIRILENVVVHKTLIDSFLDAFKEQVSQNPDILGVENLDMCIGCMQAIPNVKLFTSCGDISGQNKCTMCYCKPLWCIDCMGKWFASRQDQDRPETWLSSKCTCPMCRSTFCILDVCPVRPFLNEENGDS